MYCRHVLFCQCKVYPCQSCSSYDFNCYLILAEFYHSVSESCVFLFLIISDMSSFAIVFVLWTIRFKNCFQQRRLARYSVIAETILSACIGWFKYLPFILALLSFQSFFNTCSNSGRSVAASRWFVHSYNVTLCWNLLFNIFIKVLSIVFKWAVLFFIVKRLFEVNKG